MIEMIDIATLMTLTSWFMALYMGGHTVKDLGRECHRRGHEAGQAVKASGLHDRAGRGACPGRDKS
jgi:hypothetical protein